MAQPRPHPIQRTWSEVYEDHRLSTSSHKIRLLHLLPGPDDEPLQGTFQVVQLSQAPRFEALSYVWGGYHSSRTIHVGEENISITDNLFLALSSLRRPDTQRVLWVDAVCINQENVLERNHQVQRMGDVYNQADRVLVWLGAATEQSRAAFDFLTRSYSQSPYNRRELLDDPGWHAMKDLYARSHWSRVWIVQEICLAKQAVVICGHTQVPWAFIAELRKARKDVSFEDLSPGEQDFMRSSVAGIDYTRDTKQGRGCNLWALLETFKAWECKEIHDKIYGFLGLITENDLDDSSIDDYIPVDYTRTIEQLHEDVVYYYFQKTVERPVISLESVHLVKFSEFLWAYLATHPDFKRDTQQSDESAKMSSTPRLDFAGSALVVIERAFLPEETRPDLVFILRHLTEDSAVYSISAPEATVHVDLPIEDQPASHRDAFDQTTLFLGSYLAKDSNGIYSFSGYKVVGVAPAGAAARDIVCTFIGTPTSVIIRRKPMKAAQETTPGNGDDTTRSYQIVGRAYLNFDGEENRIPIEADQNTENDLLNDMSQRAQQINESDLWPARIFMSLSTLQTLAKTPNKHPAAHSNPNPLALDMLGPPSTSKEALSALHLRNILTDTRLCEFITGRDTLKVNTGATGFINYAAQMVYYLSPRQQAVLTTVFDPHDEFAAVLNACFDKFRSGKLPVPRATLVEVLGWTEEEVTEVEYVLGFWKAFMDRVGVDLALGAMVKGLVLSQYLGKMDGAGRAAAE